MSNLTRHPKAGSAAKLRFEFRMRKVATESILWRAAGRQMSARAVLKSFSVPVEGQPEPERFAAFLIPTPEALAQPQGPPSCHKPAFAGRGTVPFVVVRLILVLVSRLDAGRLLCA